MLAVPACVRERDYILFKAISLVVRIKGRYRRR
jgi:hypothetical protein